MPRPASALNNSVVRDRPSKRYSRSSLITASIALAIALDGEGAQAATHTVVVPADVEWFNTGIDVQEGAAFPLSISATGKWANVAKGQSVGPAGYPALRLPGAISPTEPFVSLIGRVNETIFGVGDNFRKKSPASGRLFLSMNDVPGTFGDNSGQLHVVVIQEVSRVSAQARDCIVDNALACDAGRCRSTPNTVGITVDVDKTSVIRCDKSGCDEIPVEASRSGVMTNLSNVDKDYFLKINEGDHTFVEIATSTTNVHLQFGSCSAD